MAINWILKKFEELTLAELYAILQLRNEVFVVEQKCPYQDADNKDTGSWHFMGWQNERLMAYTRIIPPGISFSECSIGRVASSPLVRGTGIGRELMKRSIEQAYTLFNGMPVRIGAQLYLRKFYNSFGFQQASDIYLEDDIEHIEMLLPGRFEV